MKRAILIATGTVGGLGAVLAVTPPQFTSTQSSPMALPGTAAAPASNAAATTTPAAAAATTPAAAAATTAATPKNLTKTPKATKTTATGTTQSQTPAANTPASTPAPAKTSAAPATKAVSGTFTGDVVNVRYGNVQVKITVENGKITDAQALQAPTGRNDRWTQMALPILRQQTLQAQSANINGASGASFTSYGWYTSLVSALAKTGM
jgi:uncharacterized protein with FMN-binding domain